MPMFELIVDNRNGTLWNLSKLVPELSWSTKRTGKAGTLQFTIIRNPTYQESHYEINCGDVVRLRMNDTVLFCGYVFVLEDSEDRELKVTAYDQLRYLLETDTYVKTNVTATQVLKDNAHDVGLAVGDIADTIHPIKTFSQDGQKRLDMIYKALDETLIAKGRIYVLYDDAGYLTLKDIDNMTIDLILGDGSLVYGYSLKRDIDSDTFNRVKMVKDNQETGKREAYILQDSSKIGKWGRLQYYQKVDDGLNKAQINAMMERVMELKGREQKTFKLDALGYIGMRAGVKLQITIKEQGINQYFLVEECTHQMKGDEHTMSLDLKVYGA